MANPSKQESMLADKNDKPMITTQQATVADAGAVTTVGSNTGTAAAGLSLIGDTSSANQAAALMNDLVALQEDISALRTQVVAMNAVLEAHGLSADA